MHSSEVDINYPGLITSPKVTAVVIIYSHQVMNYKAMLQLLDILVVVVLRSPIHANEPSEYNGMLYRTSNRVLNNGIKVIILICMDGTSQYHHYRYLGSWCGNPF